MKFLIFFECNQEEKCTHILCCDPWRAEGVNRRPLPSAATDCPRPSSIPILEQHSRPSFLPRPPLLYPAAARASFLSYRFQCPCRPEERAETSKTSPFCELIFHTSTRRDRPSLPDRSSSVNRTPGPSRHVFVANDGMTDQSTLDRTFSSETVALSFSARRIFTGQETSNVNVTSTPIVYTSSACIPASLLDLE